MIIVISIAGAAALAVIAYAQLRTRSPEVAAAGLRAVRELAVIVLVAVKAVEGVTDVLAGHARIQAAPATSSWGYRNYNEFDEDDEP